MPLSEALRAQRASFREFCQEYVMPAARYSDACERVSEALVARMASSGYFGLTVSAEHGGEGAGMLTYGLLHSEFGRACNSTRSLLTVHEMVCHAVQRWGTRAQ